MRGIVKRYKQQRFIALAIVIILLGADVGWALLRAPIAVHPVRATATLHFTTPSSGIVWPPATQSAVGYEGTAVLLAHGDQTPLPTASTAKVLTALSVLRKKPLQLGDQGPLITLTASDVAIYQKYAAQEGSVVPVAAGEQISEYQALEALMLPSANNMADSLAIWAFGSLPSYASFATIYARQLGMQHTHVGSDASGFAPDTTSTAVDLVRLGEAAMAHPVLAQIVSRSTASDIPLAGLVKNVNFLLGNSHIVGVKTGNTEQAGGVYIGAAQTMVADKLLTTVTAVVGAANLYTALQASLPLLQTAQINTNPATIIPAGSVMGSYISASGATVQAIAAEPVTVAAIGGDNVIIDTSIATITSNEAAGQRVGTMTSRASYLTATQRFPIILKNTPAAPSLGWRLLHPF